MDYTIERDMGGNLASYQQAGADLLRLHRRIVVDGICASACTMLLVGGRPMVCLTPRAELRFHMATLITPGRAPSRHRVDYPSDIQQWIDARGGLPADGWLVMRFTAAAKFFPRCQTARG